MAKEAKIKGKLRIRSLDAEDLKDIIRIDTNVTGDTSGARAEYWRKRFPNFLDRHPRSCLVATVDDKFAGVVLGDVRGWEGGVPETSGWVETIGVEPAYRGQGLAQALLKELLAYFQRAGVNHVYTLVDWEDEDLPGFFRKHGFKPSKLLFLEKPL